MNGKYRHCYCIPCRAIQRKLYPAKPEKAASYYQANKDRLAIQYSERRQADVPGSIWRDTRNSDQKKGRPNDLTKEFITEAIAPGCSYCGETEIRMTLDRIDNEGGHTKDNVVPACYRCNHTRGNMPYEAWLYLTDGMRRARLSGSFGSWAEQAFSRRR